MSHSLSFLRKSLEHFDKANLIEPSYTEAGLYEAASQDSTNEELKQELIDKFNSKNGQLLNQAENVLKSHNTRLTTHENPVLGRLQRQSQSTDLFKEMENPKDIFKRTFYSIATLILVSVVSISSLGVAWSAIAIYLIESGEFVTFYEDSKRAFAFAMPGITIAFVLKAIAELVYRNDAERRAYYRWIVKTALAFAGVWVLLFSLLFGVKQELWEVFGYITDTVFEPVFGFVFTFTQLVTEILAGAIAWIWLEKINSRNKVVIPVKNPVRLSQDEEMDLHFSDLLEREGIAGHISGFLNAAVAMRDAFIRSELRRIHAAKQKILMTKLNAVDTLKAKISDEQSSNVIHITGQH